MPRISHAEFFSRVSPSTLALLAIVVISACAALSGCTSTPHPSAAGPENTTPRVIEVSSPAASIQKAVDSARPGDLVLIAPGHYTQSVVIATKNVTLRGQDRNRVVIDGEGMRPEGILVIADGVRVQNLTVTRHTFNGVLITGLHDGRSASAHGVTGYTTLDPKKHPPIQRFAVDSVTATNNGLYGIYAFDAQKGSITNSYASGSADSGFYVGQCRNCETVVSGNVAERNAIGFETANASDSLSVVSNRFSNNRVGMTLISNHQEAFVPERSDLVAGNVISDNNEPDSPAQAEGAFGIGLGISGATENDVFRNLISGNGRVGVLFSNSEDLANSKNTIEGTVFSTNGVDVGDVSSARAPSTATCFRTNGAFSALPLVLRDGGCIATVTGVTDSAIPGVVPPVGISFLKVGGPIAQPAMAGDVRTIPGILPNTIAPFDRESVAVPVATLLLDRTGTRQ